MKLFSLYDEAGVRCGEGVCWEDGKWWAFKIGDNEPTVHSMDYDPKKRTPLEDLAGWRLRWRDE